MGRRSVSSGSQESRDFWADLDDRALLESDLKGRVTGQQQIFGGWSVFFALSGVQSTLSGLHQRGKETRWPCAAAA